MSVTGVIIIFLSIASLSFVVCEDTPSAQPTLSKVAEGGTISVNATDTTHMGREHMLKVESSTALPPKTEGHMLKVPVNVTVRPDNKTDPAPPAFEVPEKNDDKKSVPRKGVTFTDTKNVSTTAKPRKKKPLVTEGDDEPVVASYQSKEIAESVKHGLGIEAVTERRKKPDYVVPIVAVILLVPLMAIIISILYKRGAEWWQHRHYRRMDFLIEGMYNN